jgi:hypothetical protein
LSAYSSGSPVSEFANAEGATKKETDRISIPWVVCAAILCGVGVFFMTGALVRFAGGVVDTTWWLGIVPAVLGFMMLTNRRAGSNGPH